MRRYLLSLALVGLFGTLSATDAQACHKRKKCATPCAVAAPAPVPVACAPAPKKKCGLLGGGGHKMKKMGGLCHKSAPAPVVCETAYAAPSYGAPVYAAPQTYGSPQVQASGQ